MLNTLEREVVEKFRQLEPDSKQRVLALIELETNAEVEQPDADAFDYEGWFRDVENIRQEIRASHGGKLPSMDVVGMLRDIRDGEDE